MEVSQRACESKREEDRGSKREETRAKQRGGKRQNKRPEIPESTTSGLGKYGWIFFLLSSFEPWMILVQNKSKDDTGFF